MPTVTTKIYCDDWGSGRPVVFSHGWPLSANAWDRIVPIVAAARKPANLMKGSTLKCYPGAPHGLATTHADQFNADLLAFKG